MTDLDTTFPLTFTLTPSEAVRAEVEREAILADPGFGKHFTDHMVQIDWTLADGWHDAAVTADIVARSSSAAAESRPTSAIGDAIVTRLTDTPA